MRRCIKFSCIAIFGLCMFFLMEVVTYAKTPFVEFGVVRQKCSTCHKLDAKGNVEVIEETRKTPEEWKVVVHRMITVNGAPIEDREFNPVIKELSKHLILSPKEMAEVAYLNSDENSHVFEKPASKTEERIFTSCVRCHTRGKIRSHKKTRAQWVENMNMHLGYQPTTVPQMRELDWPKEAMELVDVLAELHPFENPEFRAWMKARKEQDLTGTWKVVGFQPGMGYYDGTYTFKANPKKGEDEYFVTKTVRYADGTSLKFFGEGTLYGEYHLRYALAPTPLTGAIEGVFDLDVDKMGFGGKWWAVIQDNNAYGDEEFFKVDASPRIFGLYPMALEASGKAQTLILIGLNLPKVSAADIRFADPNVKVEKVQRSYKTKIICKVVAGTNASTGASGISISGVSCDVSVTVFDKLDGIKIFPHLGRARVSCGAAYPPHGVQFVARGINYGKDGKADTADDLILDPVDAEWRLEEEKTRDGDDDLKFLMAPIVNGLYTPLTTYGPMKERHQGREGVGLIAVSASYKGLKARALLGVTDTDFVPHIK